MSGLQLASDSDLDTSAVEAAFNKAAGWIHEKGRFTSGMLTDDPIFSLIKETAGFLSKGIEKGVEESSPSEAMVNSLRESAGVFSGFKTFHEMKEAAGMLIDENGHLKPFKQFLNDVQTINETYNKNYLGAEYEFTVASSQMAAKWEDFQDEGDGRYLLQYRTVGDDKVRETHRKLNGITLPASSRFYALYYAPNGWGCRCTVVKVRAAKYPATNEEEAMKLGEKATAGKHAEMFRFNPGIQKAAYPAYNSYTVSKCSTCPKDSQLAKIAANELCRACPVIRRCAKKICKDL
jgi:SPP1 gp7 family putative phage head morphogenesis protein